MKMYRPHRLCPRNSKPKEPSLYRSLCVSILCMFLSTVMLVGTTFAWFHSSATSAVSTITAGGLDVSTSYITQNTAMTYKNSEDGIPSNEWIPFDGNGGNPFGSIPFNTNSAQVIFLKLTNNSNSHVTYRLALNLLGDTSVSANSGNTADYLSSLLRYGCSVLGPVPTGSTESNFLSAATIPGAITSDDGKTTYSANVIPESSETPPPVEISDSFVDTLFSHGSTKTECDSNGKVTRITYGGHICKVDLNANETKYISVSLYMPNGSSYGESTALVYIQLSMTVNQFNAENPLMPNVVGSAAVTQQELDAAFSLMYESFLNEDELLVVGETKSPEDNTVTNTETPAETGDATVQSPTDTEKIPVPPETPSGSTGEAGTSESGATGDTGTDTGTPAAGSESEPAPTPAA